MNNLKVSDLTELAQAINREHGLVSQAFKTAIHHAISAGELLIEAKAKVGHGAWLPWLQENCHVSERTAQAYMRLAREFPKLDSAKAQRVADLPLRTALKEIATEQRAEEWDPDEWSNLIDQLNTAFFTDHIEYQIKGEPSEKLYQSLNEKGDGSMTEREKIGFCLKINLLQHLCYWTNFRKTKGKDSLPLQILEYLDAMVGEETLKVCRGECRQEF